MCEGTGSGSLYPAPLHVISVSGVATRAELGTKLRNTIHVPRKNFICVTVLGKVASCSASQFLLATLSFSGKNFVAEISERLGAELALR